MFLFGLPGIHEIPDFLPLFPQMRFSFTLGVYFAWMVLLYLLARKTKHKAMAPLAFVPILNFALLFKIGRFSPWLALLMLVPVVNCIMLWLVYSSIVKQAQKPWWWALLMFVNPVSIVIMIMVLNAFEEKANPTSGFNDVESAFKGEVDPFTQKVTTD